MKVESREELGRSYLCLQTENAPDPDGYEVQMVSGNEMPGLLPCRTEMIDGSVRFCYEVTGKVPLARILEKRPADGYLLRFLFSSLRQVIQTLSEYLLTEEGLLLDPQQIYMDEQASKVWFCYLPGAEETFQQQALRLGELILQKLDHSQQEAVILGYAFYQKCAGGESSDRLFAELLDQHGGLHRGGAGEEAHEEVDRGQLLDAFFSEGEEEKEADIGLFARLRGWLPRLFRRRKGAAQAAEKHAAAAGDFLPTNETHPLFAGEKIMQKEPAVSPPREVPLPKDLCEEMPLPGAAQASLDGEEETLDLRGQNDPRGRAAPCRAQLVLLNAAGGEEGAYLLTEETYLIGKSRQAAGVVLPFPEVSRVHAGLRWLRDRKTYQLTDLHSRNGTWVNGEKIASDETIELKNDDNLDFADKKLIYKSNR